MTATLSGIAAAMWLGGLWYAAPLLSCNDEIADRSTRRLRDATLLGTGIPLALAAASLLTGVTCVAALVGWRNSWREATATVRPGVSATGAAAPTAGRDAGPTNP